jgi:energy-coupling factor transport system permease protein
LQWIASGFLFQKGRTFVHSLDPRVRLAISFSLFVVALLSHSILELSILIAITLCIAVGAKILKRFGRTMVFTGAISIIAFALNLYTTPSNLHGAIVFGVRLFAVISSTSIFFLTSTPDELEQVMRWMRLPPDFVMVFVIAVRFVPVLLLDALQIMDAQRSRGLELDRGNFVKRLRNSIPVIIPLIAVALNRSLDLAEAMDSRAYGAVKKPTSLYHLKLGKRDYAVLLLTLILSALGVYAALFLKFF